MSFFKRNKEKKEKQPKIETYSAKWWCGNCHETGYFWIPKGQSFDSFQATQKCTRCGIGGKIRKW